MTLSDDDRLIIEPFLVYIEEFEEPDERYGPAGRHAYAKNGCPALRFMAGTDWSFEVHVEAEAPRVRIAFVSEQSDVIEEVLSAMEESGTTPEALVESGFRETGLNWPEPPVERIDAACGTEGFATFLPLEDLVDLTDQRIRTKIIKMLEGFLIAFGPEVELEYWDDEAEHAEDGEDDEV